MKIRRSDSTYMERYTDFFPEKKIIYIAKKSYFHHQWKMQKFIGFVEDFCQNLGKIVSFKKTNHSSELRYLCLMKWPS